MSGSSRLILLFLTLLAPSAQAADSGPAAGTDVAPFSAFVVTGEGAGQTVDVVAQRAGQPTLYCFVPKDRWSRPSARLLRKLDESITAAASDARIIAVWVTSDAPASRDYLPQAQQSLQFSHTSLTVYEAGSSGPPEWGINTDVDVTIVATRGTKVLKSFALTSPNDTVADEIRAVLQE